MRITTWNVNSVKQRVPRLLPWLDERQPDVVCLQETKLTDEAFAELLGAELAERGYEVATHGEAAWNGVAILSRVGLEDVVAGIEGGPGFPHQEARAVTATCAGVRVTSVYVPNGRAPDSEHYHYKLAWLAALKQMIAAGPEAAIVLGDMNIAPTDEDVFDPDAYIGQTHVTEPERAALADLQSLGLRDVVRDRWPDKRVFTYWDYRAGMFHKDLGMRIDLALASAPVAERVKAAWVDRHARKGSGPSDHAPVIVDLDEAPDGDIGPVVPPPSAPAAKRGTVQAAAVLDVDHAALVRADADRPVALAHLDVEAQLALVDDLAQPRRDGALCALERTADVLDAHLEADGGLLGRQRIADQRGCRRLHHRDHPRRREDGKRQRPLDVGQKLSLDAELVGPLDAFGQRHGRRLRGSEQLGRLVRGHDRRAGAEQRHRGEQDHAPVAAELDLLGQVAPVGHQQQAGVDGHDRAAHHGRDREQHERLVEAGRAGSGSRR